MSNNTKKYREGELLDIYHKDGRFLTNVVLHEAMCKAGLDRLLFFKFNIVPGEYVAKVVRMDD